jgi:hypothetical protein
MGRAGDRKTGKRGREAGRDGRGMAVSGVVLVALARRKARMGEERGQERAREGKRARLGALTLSACRPTRLGRGLQLQRHPTRRLHEGQHWTLTASKPDQKQMQQPTASQTDKTRRRTAQDDAGADVAHISLFGVDTVGVHMVAQCRPHSPGRPVDAMSPCVQVLSTLLKIQVPLHCIIAWRGILACRHA